VGVYFDRELDIFSRTTCFIPTLFNFTGDYGYDSRGECAVPMVHRIHSPSNGNGLFWYSFDVRPIHIIYFSTEHDFCRSSIQYAWLEQDLRSVNRSRTPWLIVGSHRLMYASIRDDPQDFDFIALMLQFHLEPYYFIDIMLMLISLHIDIHMTEHVQCINEDVYRMV